MFARRRPLQPGERIAGRIPIECLGQKCVNYAGVACDSYLDLIESDGNDGGVDQPPLREGATFAMYGQFCVSGEVPELKALWTQRLQQGARIEWFEGIGQHYGDLEHTVLPVGEAIPGVAVSNVPHS